VELRFSHPESMIYVLDPVPPNRSHEARYGRWFYSQNHFSEPETHKQRFFFSSNKKLLHDKGKEEGLKFSHNSPVTLGISAPSYWCSYGLGQVYAGDQQEDDSHSLSFDTLPFTEDTVFLGSPVFRFNFSVDKQKAFVVARLCDVSPDGKSLLISWGALNLNHYKSHEFPESLTPNKEYSATLTLNDVANTIPASHKLRLAISTNYWPTIWPSPENPTLSFFADNSVFEIPVANFSNIRSVPNEISLPPNSSNYSTDAVEYLKDGQSLRTEEIDKEGNSVIVLTEDSGINRVKVADITNEYYQIITMKIHPSDPLSAHFIIEHDVKSYRGEWHVAVKTKCDLRSTKENFLLQVSIIASENNKAILERNSSKVIPRTFL